MTENPSPGFGEIRFQAHEAEPLPWKTAGISEESGEEPARKVVALLVNLSERGDLAAVIEAHQKELEGAYEYCWAPDPEDDKTILLAMSFTKPVQANAYLAFDILKHGPIVDCLVEGAMLHLVPGTQDENLWEILATERPHLVLDLDSIGIIGQWDSIWSSTVANELEIPLVQAEVLTKRWKQETSLRLKIPGMPPMDSIAGAFFDDQIEKMVFVTNDLLTNQLTRDGPKTAKSFDTMFETLLQELSSEYSRLTAEVVPIITRAARSGDRLEATCGELIGNALITSVAALELIRLGYRHQPGALLRNALEAIAMASHLRETPGDLGRALAGQLNSSNIDAAKRILPGFGRIYGYITKQFSHISPIHFRTEPPSSYSSEDDLALQTNLMGVRLLIFLNGVYAEAIFFESVPQPHYWKRITPDQIQYGFSPEAQEYFDRMLEDFSIPLEGEE